jgi:hypothetical protein
MLRDILLLVLAVTATFWVVRKNELEKQRKHRLDRQMLFSPGTWISHNP